MSFFDWGNNSISSTTAQPLNNPTTGTLIAEIDSSQLGTAVFNGGFQQNARVSWIVGVASTVGVWQLEHVLSTGLGSTAIIDQVMIGSATAQSAEFITTHRLATNSRLRARLFSSVSGNAFGFIQAELLT